MKLTSLSAFRTFASRKAREKKELREEPLLLVCAGTGCVSGGSLDVFEALRKERGRKKKPRLQVTGCRGFCENGPLVVQKPQGFLYNRVKVKDAPDLIEAARSGQPVQRLLVRDAASRERIARLDDVPFYSGQKRLALRHLGEIDPGDIGGYVAAGGYRALADVLDERSPEDVIEAIEKSGLRGRGGAGFPAGRKWRTCRNADAEPKYVICNADEGDPGAFMDRSLCEGDPHAVLEGMLLCGYAVGSHSGVIYVREEYPLAVEYLSRAVDAAREHGFLGEDILGTGFSFDIRLSRGGGAFVCGESSALMKSVAGEVGEPRAKYIRSVIKGLFDKPTVLNNVETFVNVPYILARGPEHFAGLGTETSPGTKVFSLVGKVNNTGLVEVEMGTTLRDIIFGIGGGIRRNRPFKAVQTGGPSGGCLPADKLDLPVDFDTLTEAGSMMGSGGMIVMDDHTCMVDVARYFLAFLREESCGKCVPCREGVAQLHDMVDAVCRGRAGEGDLERIEALAAHVETASLCALGKSAPNPVRSTLRYFRDEYEAHIHERRCPAGVCRELTTFAVDAELCTGCGACQRVCPAGAIEGKGKKTVRTIVDEKCTRCGSCRTVCPADAISPV